MNRSRLLAVLRQQVGVVDVSSYDTAWVALVPDEHDPTKPAWPRALQYLRDNQLADGGWGSEYVFYAHGRTICTLAALWALLTWERPEDEARIADGVAALYQYAQAMALEPYEPIGFEILLPRLVQEIKQWGLDLPLTAWSKYESMTAQKMTLIGRLQPDYDKPRSWWFSMEMLPTERLAAMDDRVLNVYGSVATATAATAAYLRAKRLRGQDSSLATAYLTQVLNVSRSGGVGFCYPLEQFEAVWTLDVLRRIGLDPTLSPLMPTIRRTNEAWQASAQGMSWSRTFPIADGDVTAVAYTILSWAGLKPDDRSFRRFWGSDYYLNYPDELVSSVTSNIHALTALQDKLDNRDYRQMAERIIAWLRENITYKNHFHDKWHFSPLYATSRAISVLIAWDKQLARKCLKYLLETQDESGGWGVTSRPNLEETSYAVVGLAAAYRHGLLANKDALKQADAFLKKRSGLKPIESFWIGKTLYRPIGVANAYVYGATTVLRLLDVDAQRPSLWANPSISRPPDLRTP